MEEARDSAGRKVGKQMRKNFIYIPAILLLILCAASFFILGRIGSENHLGRPEARGENKSAEASQIGSEKSLGQDSVATSKLPKAVGKSKAYVLGEQTKTPSGNALEAIDKLRP